MEYSRDFRIQSRVITADLLRRLGQLIKQEADAIDALHRPADEAKAFWYSGPNRSFQIAFENGTTIKSDSPEIFSDSGQIGLQRPSSVKMSMYWSSGDRNSISLGLSHGNDGFSNRVSVSGNSKAWVDATVQGLGEIIQSAPRQDHFIIRNPWLLKASIAVSTGLLYTAILIRFLSFLAHPAQLNETPSKLDLLVGQYPWVAWLVAYSILGLLPGSLTASFAYEKLASLWPSIEFQIGPEHLQLEKSRRKSLAQAWALIGLPAILGVCLELIFRA